MKEGILTYPGDHRSGFKPTWDRLTLGPGYRNDQYFLAVEAWLVEIDGKVYTKVRMEQV